jgi:hypothetical protein
MPFQKKVKATDPETTGAEVNTSVPTEKNKEKKNDVAAEVKAQRELYEKNQEIEDLKRELELAKHQKLAEPVLSVPGLDLITKLEAQVQLLSSQVRGGVTGDKLRFRQPTAADLVPPEKAVTFTARSVYYIVGSYLDQNGIEQIPPFKLIIFLYAASDIRKDGPEATIKNFSTYTTRLQPEIDYLRNSPYYNIQFGENTNEMMKEDTKDIQFRTNAATALQSAAPEDIYAKAEQLKIPNYRSKSASELKGPIIAKMVEEYKKQEEDLQREIINRNMIRQEQTQE